MAKGVQIRNSKIEICVDPQLEDLTETQFEALDWVEICCVTELPNFASEANMISQNCIDGSTMRGVGANADSDITVTYGYVSDCEGQRELEGMAEAKDGVPYAMRKVYSDGVAGVTTPTISNIRAIWSSFDDGGGDIDGFFNYTVGGAIVQGPMYVAPAPVGP